MYIKQLFLTNKNMSQFKQEAEHFFVHDAATGNRSARFIRDVPPNTVQVDNGGTFSSIQAAIDSIQKGDIFIGPGEYHERIILKDGIRLTGSADHNTTITAPADALMTPTVYVSGNCSIYCLIINSVSNAPGLKPCALVFSGEGCFNGYGLWIAASNEGKPGSTITAIKSGSKSSRGFMKMDDCRIFAFAFPGESATVTGVECDGYTESDFRNCFIRAVYSGTGILAKGNSFVMLNQCTVHGEQWSIINQGKDESMQVSYTKLEGPYSGDITIN
jgi:hypothetical protein